MHAKRQWPSTASSQDQHKKWYASNISRYLSINKLKQQTCDLDLYHPWKVYGMGITMQTGKDPNMTSELLSYVNWCKALIISGAYYGLSNLQTKKPTPETLEPVHRAHKLARQGAAVHRGQWHDGQQEKETLPAATGRLTLVFEYSHMFCQENDHNPPSRALLSQTQNYRVKMNSPDIFFHSVSTGAMLDNKTLKQRKSHV